MILIIENHPEALELRRDIFASDGRELMAAGDGETRRLGGRAPVSICAGAGFFGAAVCNRRRALGKRRSRVSFKS